MNSLFIVAVPPVCSRCSTPASARVPRSRSSRAVRAHSDDQDVFILQLAGSKAWNVYGSPVELPYTHEQLGKRVPIGKETLGEPTLRAELRPGAHTTKSQRL